MTPAALIRLDFEPSISPSTEIIGVFWPGSQVWGWSGAVVERAGEVFWVGLGLGSCQNWSVPGSSLGLGRFGLALREKGR
jgi:hypothetical protein